MALEGFQSHLVDLRGNSGRTAETYSRHVRALLEENAVVEWREISLDLLTSHLRLMFLAGRSEAYRHAMVSAVRAWARFVVLTGRWPECPLRDVPLPKVVRRRSRTLSVAEVERVVYDRALPADPLRGRNRALVAVLYGTGMRASEVAQVRGVDLEWSDDRKLAGLVIRPKGAQAERVAWMDERTTRVLRSYLESVRPRLGKVPWLFPQVRGSSPLSRQAVNGIAVAELQRAGIERKGRRFCAHQFRHAATVHRIEAGWPLDAVRESLGHRSIETTLLYIEPASEATTRRLLRRQSPTAKRRGARVDLRKAAPQFLAEVVAGRAPHPPSS